MDSPPSPVQIANGLLDCLDVLQDALTAAGQDTAAVLRWRLETRAVHEHLSLHAGVSAEGLLGLLQRIGESAADSHGEASDDSAFWHQALTAQCRDLHDELLWRTPPPMADGRRFGLLSWRQLAELDTDYWLPRHHGRIAALRELALERCTAVNQLLEQVTGMAQMDFGFLYDTRRHLLVIGYNADEHRLDAGYYDLLASEVRLTHFVAIAQGQLPQESWFALGRLLTSSAGTRCCCPGPVRCSNT